LEEYQTENLSSSNRYFRRVSENNSETL